MTATAPSPTITLATESGGIEWRSTHRDFWVGRRDGQHVGAIEHGRHFTALDENGEVLAWFRTLEEAMTSFLTSTRRVVDVPARRSWGVLATITTVAMVATSAFAVYALTGVVGLAGL